MRLFNNEMLSFTPSLGFISNVASHDITDIGLTWALIADVAVLLFPFGGHRSQLSSTLCQIAVVR